MEFAPQAPRLDRLRRRRGEGSEARAYGKMGGKNCGRTLCGLGWARPSPSPESESDPSLRSFVALYCNRRGWLRGGSKSWRDHKRKKVLFFLLLRGKRGGSNTLRYCGQQLTGSRFHLPTFNVQRSSLVPSWPHTRLRIPGGRDLSDQFPLVLFHCRYCLNHRSRPLYIYSRID